MAQFKVNTDQMRERAATIGKLQQELNEVTSKLSGIKVESVLQIKAAPELLSKVEDCSLAIIHQTVDLRKLASCLDTAANLYEQTEKNLSDPKTTTQAHQTGGVGGISVLNGFALATPMAAAVTEEKMETMPFGGGKGGGGFRDSDIAVGSNETQWESLKKAWRDAGESYEWLEENYEKLPEWLRKDLEKAVGSDVKAAVQILGDILKGDITLDTLSSYLDGIGVEATKASAVIETIKVVVKPNATMKSLMDAMDDYQQRAVQDIINGDVKGFFVNSGKSIGSGLLSIGYGVEEVATELIAGTVDSTGKKISSGFDILGHIVPSTTGKVITNISSELDTVVAGVSGWLRKLL